MILAYFEFSSTIGLEKNAAIVGDLEHNHIDDSGELAAISIGGGFGIVAEFTLWVVRVIVIGAKST
jgi:hypothetical protein